jgi:hypothetical protein
MSNPPNQPSFTGSSTIGSHIVSVHSERKLRVYPVFEPELDNLSNLNNATTLFSSLAMIFIPFFIENIQHLKPNYNIYLDPFGWISLFFLLMAGLTVYLKMGITKKIKNASTAIPS